MADQPAASAAPVDPNANNADSMLDEKGRRRSEVRRLTAASDWTSMPAHVRAQLERKNHLWILEAATPDISEHYTIGEQIGQPGQFGRAHRCEHKATGEKRAVKVVSKTKFSRTADKKMHFKELRLEIDILRQLQHDNIIRLFDVYESIGELFIVMELCGGGELFDRIKAHPSGSYSEKDAQQVLRQICIGLAYLHKNRIVHCDLKPDNFLFADPSKEARLKIIDFGMSKFVKRRQYFHSIRGTPYYIAPEVIKGQYNASADMWSLGVVMFVMLFGYPPFHADSDQEIFRQVLEGFNPIVKKGYKAHFPAAIPASDAAKDLIAKLLTSDTAKRLTAEEALEHPWLTGESSSATPMVGQVLTNLKNFSAHSKFKQGILNLMVNTLSETDLQNLKRLFAELDADGNGHITVAELSAAVEKSGALADSLSSGGQSKLTHADLQRILAAADIDGDGTISYNELVLTTVQRKLSAKEERMWLAFNKIDLNRDGRLSVEELASVLGEDAQEAAKMIAAVDTNKDGSIDFDEFLDLWTRRAQDEATKPIVQQIEHQPHAPDLPPGASLKDHQAEIQEQQMAAAAAAH